MATANIIWGAAKGGMPVFSSDFESENIAGGSTTTDPVPANSIVRVTAIDGAVYAAFGTAATADPRVYVAAGASIDVHRTEAGDVSIETYA